MENSSSDMAALHSETEEKIKNGYDKVVRYGDIKSITSVKLKIPPVAMILHKTQEFITILDLSSHLKKNW